MIPPPDLAPTGLSNQRFDPSWTGQAEGVHPPKTEREVVG